MDKMERSRYQPLNLLGIQRGTLRPSFGGNGHAYQQWVSQFSGEPHVNTFSRSDGTDVNQQPQQRVIRYL